MAKAVYEEILSATPFTRQWILASEPVIDLTIPLILGGYIGGMDVTSGTLIDIRDCVRDLELDIRYYRYDDDEADQTHLPKLERGMFQLCQLPRLRRVKLTFGTPGLSDAYHEKTLFFERISSAIKQLKKRLGDKNVHLDLLHSI